MISKITDRAAVAFRDIPDAATVTIAGFGPAAHPAKIITRLLGLVARALVVFKHATGNANPVRAGLADPAILLTLIQIVRSIKLGKLIPIALAGAAAFGAANLVDKRSAANGRKSGPKETKRAA